MKHTYYKGKHISFGSGK